MLISLDIHLYAHIKAYIKPHKLSAVTLALHRVEGLSGMSVSDTRGFGRGKAKDAPHTIREDLVDFIPCVKIEIVCLFGINVHCWSPVWFSNLQNVFSIYNNYKLSYDRFSFKI